MCTMRRASPQRYDTMPTYDDGIWPSEKWVVVASWVFDELRDRGSVGGCGSASQSWVRYYNVVP